MSEKKQLNDEELENVTGGTQRTIKEIDYKCNACSHTWTSQGSSSVCPSCGSSSISKA